MKDQEEHNRPQRELEDKETMPQQGSTRGPCRKPVEQLQQHIRNRPARTRTTRRRATQKAGHLDTLGLQPFWAVQALYTPRGQATLGPVGRLPQKNRKGPKAEAQSKVRR